VKLLFDESLRLRLVGLFADLFPGSAHVRDVGLGATADAAIWEWAREQGFAIVTKDGDFEHRAIVYGAPPKVIRLRAGNVGTAEFASRLRDAVSRITTFLDDPVESLLVV
jgi:predicted nuclease of predicted toxin-antitoxin system